jgi:hypothetical protein
MGKKSDSQDKTFRKQGQVLYGSLWTMQLDGMTLTSKEGKEMIFRCQGETQTAVFTLKTDLETIPSY